MTTLQLFLAQDAPGTQQPGGSLFSSPIVMVVLMIVMMYFIMIRPQRKKQAELQQQISSLRGGDTVVTAGGIHGLVVSVQDRTLTLKIADNVKVKIEKTGIVGVLKKSEEAEAIEAETEPADSAKK
jgi:preprotein translocase subunit YajC